MLARPISPTQNPPKVPILNPKGNIQTYCGNNGDNAHSRARTTNTTEITSKAGKLFDATLVLNTETGKMEFKFS